MRDQDGTKGILDAIVASGYNGGWVRPGAVHRGAATECLTNTQSSSNDFPRRTEVRVL